jgi:DNA-binding transcriptional ArsR family regulator
MNGKRASVGKTPVASGWTFFSNHGHVLFCLARDDSRLLRDVATEVGITERAVQRIASELEEAGVLTREREGRRNRYRITRTARLRHPIEGHCTVGSLLDLINGRRS